MTDLNYDNLSDHYKEEINSIRAREMDLKGQKELMKELQQVGICASSNNPSAKDPVLDRNYVQWLGVTRGYHTPPRTPYRPGKDPIPISKPAPTLGQHNKAVLGELLGLSNATLTELISEGIIGTKPRLSR